MVYVYHLVLPLSACTSLVLHSSTSMLINQSMYAGIFLLLTIVFFGTYEGVEASSPCRRYLSGTPDEDVSFQSTTGVAFRGYKTRGGWYKTVKNVSSLSECFETCVNETRCSSFTYKASRDSCSLSKKSGATSSSEVSSDTVKFCRSRSSIAGFMAAPRSPATALPPSHSSKPEFTLQEVAQHNVSGDAWVVVDDKVYDLSDFVSAHPGGSNAILRVAGGDGTSLFEGTRAHGSAERGILNGYYIGEVKSYAPGPSPSRPPSSSPSPSPSSGGSNSTMSPGASAPGPSSGDPRPPGAWWGEEENHEEEEEQSHHQEQEHNQPEPEQHQEEQEHNQPELEQHQEEQEHNQPEPEQHQEQEEENHHPVSSSSPAPITSSPSPNPSPIPSPIMSQPSPESGNHGEEPEEEHHEEEEHEEEDGDK
jgi:cytochrome b involved in lipid metabolism